MEITRISGRVLLLVALAVTTSAQPVRELLKRPDFRLYTVIFGVTIDERGQITKFHVSGVTDAKSYSTALLPIKVPAGFAAGARKKVQANHPKPRLKNGKPAEFFTYYFYAPDYPTKLISDLYLPPENQP
jgi:hypothetical protein